MKRLLSLLLLLIVLLTSAACAAELTDGGLTLLGCEVHYPKLEGLEDETLQAGINDALLEAGHIREYLNRVSLIAPSGGKLTVSYDARITGGNLLTCVFRAEGSVDDKGTTDMTHAVTIDLNDGHRVTLNEITDTGILEAYLIEEVLPSMDAFLGGSDLTDLPDDFIGDSTGLTLYYSRDAYTTLNGEAGVLHLSWSELEDIDLSEGSMPSRFGAAESMTLHGLAEVESALDGDTFPGLSVKLGDPISPWLASSTEPKAPDYYLNGRMLSFDNGEMRGVFLLTDDLSADLTESVVLAIRTDRACVAGLCTGITTFESWREHLGEPDATVEMDDETAEAMRMVSGTSDYYSVGSHQLRLHADQDGILRSIILME